MATGNKPVVAQVSVAETKNEISSAGIFFGGLLLILFSLLPLVAIIAFWPDRMPEPTEKGLYQFRLFHITLLTDTATTAAHEPSSVTSDANSPGKSSSSPSSTTTTVTSTHASTASAGNPSNGRTTASADTSTKKTSTSAGPAIASTKKSIPKTVTGYKASTIHINMILFLIVAFAGFLGSMVHIATSFTNFVGSEKFKQSWILWYFVKPFTAAAIAIIMYFVFRAGLLSFGDSTNVNLYGLAVLSALAGLFTDKATLKLEEVFTVIFKPKDERPDKLEEKEVTVKISGVKPESLALGADNNLVISGTGLDKQQFVIKINDKEISDPVIAADSISFTYRIPEELKQQKELNMIIVDKTGKEIFKNIFHVSEAKPGEGGV